MAVKLDVSKKTCKSTEKSKNLQVLSLQKIDKGNVVQVKIKRLRYVASFLLFCAFIDSCNAPALPMLDENAFTLFCFVFV